MKHILSLSLFSQGNDLDPRSVSNFQTGRMISDQQRNNQQSGTPLHVRARTHTHTHRAVPWNDTGSLRNLVGEESSSLGHSASEAEEVHFLDVQRGLQAEAVMDRSRAMTRLFTSSWSPRALLNQTQVHTPLHSKASLLTLGLGEGARSVHFRYQAESLGSWCLKALRPWRLSGKGF